MYGVQMLLPTISKFIFYTLEQQTLHPMQLLPPAPPIATHKPKNAYVCMCVCVGLCVVALRPNAITNLASRATKIAIH